MLPKDKGGPPERSDKSVPSSISHTHNPTADVLKRLHQLDIADDYDENQLEAKGKEEAGFEGEIIEESRGDAFASRSEDEGSDKDFTACSASDCGYCGHCSY